MSQRRLFVVVLTSLGFGHCWVVTSPTPPGEPATNSSGARGQTDPVSQGLPADEQATASDASTSEPKGEPAVAVRAKTIFAPGGLEVPTILGTIRYFPGFLLRVLLPVAVILIGFSVLPTFGGWSGAQVLLGELFFIVIWLAMLFPLYLNHQIRRILTSQHPQAAWMEALIVIGTLFLAIFAHIYRVLGAADASSFTETMDLLNSYYYSLTVLSTLGLGDITPVTDNAKIFTMIQIVCDIALIGLVLRVLSSARGSAAAQAPSRDAASP